MKIHLKGNYQITTQTGGCRERQKKKSSERHFILDLKRKCQISTYNYGWKCKENGRILRKAFHDTVKEKMGGGGWKSKDFSTMKQKKSDNPETSI